MRTALAVAGLFVLAAVLFVALGFSRLPPRPDGPPVTALAAGTDTLLDTTIAPLTTEHPGESGFHLLPDGVGAFAMRALSARAAGRSLDVQYYIWHDDMTGRLLALELLEAADRGVRVRLLLDDMDARAKNFTLATLAAHPNISVRLFNPLASRQGMFGKGVEALTSFSRINHRMHNKSWIADNRVAIVGGRNVGDEYFAAGKDTNFRDLDLAIVGPAVEEFSAAFDGYWNSDVVWPIEQLSPDAVDQSALTSLRERGEAYAATAKRSPYLMAMEGHDAVKAARASAVPMEWTSQWQVLVDSPDKASDPRPPMQSSAVLDGLGEAILGASREVVLISPYFVPGDSGTEALVGAVGAGRSVRILTNSLAANDVAVVHGGYAKYREPLLAGGVQLWELRPDNASGASTELSLFGSSGASLHSKAAVFDDETAFVGSFNLDPRSVSLNCEQGVLVTDPVIAAQVEALFDRMTRPGASWRVTLDDEGDLRWEGRGRTHDSEPAASWGRRAQAKIAGWLPVEALL